MRAGVGRNQQPVGAPPHHQLPVGDAVAPRPLADGADGVDDVPTAGGQRHRVSEGSPDPLGVGLLPVGKLLQIGRRLATGGWPAEQEAAIAAVAVHAAAAGRMPLGRMDASGSGRSPHAFSMAFAAAIPDTAARSISALGCCMRTKSPAR